jgi:uncharacterized protein (DUF362 family)
MDNDIFKQDVFVLKTDLMSYTSNWHDKATFPESEALKSLVDLARTQAGYDIFEQVIRPGDRVVIKPNLVRDWHPGGMDLWPVVTHPAIIRAVVDNTYRALRGEGEIIIADAPMGDTNFANLLQVTGLPRIADYYWREHRFEIGLRDLRDCQEVTALRPGGYRQGVRRSLAGDPQGYCEVDLGPQSAFRDLPNLELLEGTSVGLRNETKSNHTSKVNCYLVSRTVLNADTVISIPKLKTHCKIGTTLNCKGMVGINGNKNRLPHFRIGSSAEGGDQFPNGLCSTGARRRIALGHILADKLVQRQARWADALLGGIQAVSGVVANDLFHLPSLDPLTAKSGNWPGNDTCWRLAVDLIRIAVFAGADGRLHDRPQRRFLSIVDGIVGGEGDGPLSPSPKQCGVLLAGLHPVAVDMVGTRLMGFDQSQVRYLRELSEGACAALRPSFGPLRKEQIRVYSNHEPWCRLFNLPVEQLLGFAAPPNWAVAIGLFPDDPAL